MSLRTFFIGIYLFSILLASCTPSKSDLATNQPVPRLATATLSPTGTPVTPQVASQPTETSTSTAVINIPDPADYDWAQVVTGISGPTDIQSAGDGSGRMFILEQPGQIRILINGQLLETPFLDIVERVGSNGSEQGLLGLAFHPRFAQNGYFYVNYTDTAGNTHISRFTASGDKTDPASEKQLIFVQQPFSNHNGGAIAFGLDGFLYIGLGDGGSGGDPYGNAQSGNSLLGKILRIDVDGGDPYAIPADNPYASSGEVYKEIWAGGLRNPWRFSFDPVTYDLWIGDVGQNQWEEINFVIAGTPGGLNFGWNKMEATHPFKGSSQPEFISPVAEYSHSAGCSVTGGYVYRGNALPAWQGVYLYGDYCSGTIWGLPSPPTSTAASPLFETGFRISTFGVDDAGELYVADYNGAIYRLQKRR